MPKMEQKYGETLWNRRKLSVFKGKWRDRMINEGKMLAIDSFYLDNAVETEPELNVSRETLDQKGRK